MKKNIKCYIIAILPAFVYILLFSTSTSPLYGFTAYGGDSYIFQTIGKNWSSQCIPYKRLFDHKGPLIFFIDKVGYLLTNSRCGIFVVQIVCMAFLIGIMFKMYRQVLPKYIALILTGVSMTGLSICYEEGNLTEEYILPFLMASFGHFWTWMNEYMTKRQVEHKSISAFLYGVTFGVAAMTRINNAVGICIIMLFMTIILIKEKKWRNLYLNICLFGGGVFLIIIPFCLYFAIHNALYEMWFGTIAFNISYVENSQGVFASISLKKLIRFLVFFFSSYNMLFVGILIFMKKKRRYIAIFMMILSGITTLMFASGRAYGHYDMICLPYFVVSIMELAKLKDAQMRNKMAKGTMAVFSAVFIVGGLYSTWIRYNIWNKTEKLTVVDEIMSLIPDDDKDSFIAWDCPTYLYLKYDIKPFYKYFIFQENHAEINDEVREDIQEVFETGMAKWILIKDGTQKVIKDVLAGRYTLINEQFDGNEKFMLYQKKNIRS